MDVGTGHLGAERFKCFLDPLDRATLSEWQLRALDRVSVEREAKHRPLLRLVLDVRARKRVDDKVKSSRRIVRCVVGKQRRRTDFWVGGNEQRALIREVPIRGRARDRRRLRGPLDRQGDATGNELASRGDERVTSAALLVRATLELVWD